MKLHCQNCGYTWEYRGHSRWYATCPKCRYKVRVALRWFP